MVLKGKSKLKPGSKKWSFSIFQPDSLQRSIRRLTPFQKKTISILTLFALVIYFLNSLFQLRSGSGKMYPIEHGYYQAEVAAPREFIYPSVNDVDMLQLIGIRGLFTLRTEVDGESRFVLSTQDKPLSEEERKKSSDEVLLVKKAFLDNGKLIYRKETAHPEIVIVTLVDFESDYPVETMVQIIQNRIDYAQKHNYGVYVRWVQEFIPLLKDQDVQKSYESIKPLVMRAAIHAFPQAKFLMFVDQNALIMQQDIPLQQHILDPRVVEMGLLKGVPVYPGSNIKTYTNFNPAGAKIIIPHDADGFFDLSTFVISTDLYGRAFLEFLTDPLFMDYTWPSFLSSVGHLLQWHPQLLKRTAIVTNKLIAATYDPTKGLIGKATEDTDTASARHYREGDLIVSLKGCQERGSCVGEINSFYSLLKN